MSLRRRDGNKAKGTGPPTDLEGWFPDPQGVYESRLRQDGQWTGWVSHKSWDPHYGGQPDSRGSSNSCPTMLVWHGKRVVITGPGGDTLDVALDSCVSARFDEVPSSDGKGIALRLQVELSGGPSQISSRTRVCLVLPGEGIAELKGFVDAVRSERERSTEKHYGDKPTSHTSAESPSSAAGPRHATRDGKSVRDSLRNLIHGPPAGRNEALLNTVSTMADQVLNADEQPRKGVINSAVQDLGERGASTREARRSVPDTTMPPDIPPNLTRLLFARVPDTEDWLSFHPLASAEEIRVRETSGHENLAARNER